MSRYTRLFFKKHVDSFFRIKVKKEKWLWLPKVVLWVIVGTASLVGDLLIKADWAAGLVVIYIPCGVVLLSYCAAVYAQAFVIPRSGDEEQPERKGS